MSEENPQNKYLIISKKFAIAQDICGALAFILAIVQGITLIISAKSFLIIAGVILIVEYISSHCKSYFLIKGIA